VRTDKIAQLLVETQLSVREIADAMGFGDVQHFARYFRSVRNVSPLAYRRSLGGHQAPEARAQIGDSFTQIGVDGLMPEWYQ
jgi:transcriptional regulator GlxA family with amidase domain